MEREQLVKLNLGCGQNIVDGWINTDYSIGARIGKVPIIKSIVKNFGVFSVDWSEEIFISDLTKPFLWQDNEVDVIYSSHTLEHLDKSDGRAFISECHRVLKPGGIVRIVVPNLDNIIKRYLDKELQPDDFIDYLEVRTKSHRSPLKRLISSIWSFPHKCMYTPDRLTELMQEVGLSGSQHGPFESAIEGIELIELPDRVSNDEVIFEGRKQ